jgi:hypothetical protein
MKERNPKFILLKSGELKIQYCSLHKELAGNDENNPDVIGGGWWHLNDNHTEITFYGLSTDFGNVTDEQIIESLNSDAKRPRALKNVEKVFHAPFYALNLTEAMEKRVLIYTFI